LWGALAPLLFLAATAAFGANFYAGKLICGYLDGYCPLTTDKSSIFVDTLLGPGGNQRYGARKFEVDFSTVSDVSFRTDHAGRFCIQWSREEVEPSFSTPTGEPLHRRGAGVVGGPGWHDLEGRRPPAGCEQGNADIPWHRAQGIDTRWQYWLLNILPTTALLALVLAWVNRRRWAWQGLVLAGALLTADIVVGTILWSL
jgi:hypothetical protein